MKLPLLILLLAALTGCSSHTGRKMRQTAAVTVQKTEVLQEKARELNTGVVDTLAIAPTNSHTRLALTLAKAEQQIVGVPAARIDVEAVLNHEKPATATLASKLREIETVVSEKKRLDTLLHEQTAVLAAKGETYEAQQNQHVVKRLWRWLFATFGLAGLVVLCLLCPAFLPLLARLAAWLVAKIPALAGALGVVSKQAFDAVVSGVGAVRSQWKRTGDPALKTLDDELKKSTDQNHRSIIESRRNVLGV